MKTESQINIILNDEIKIKKIHIKKMNKKLFAERGTTTSFLVSFFLLIKKQIVKTLF
jgi:hypothetical protein